MTSDNGWMRNPFIQPITILGETRGRGPCKRFGIYQVDRHFHTYVIGQTGTGKSTLLLNMLRQDAENARGFCLVDPHGDLAESAAGYIEEDGIYWDISDPDCTYGYNPLTYVDARFRPLVASGIIETLKQQWSDAWGVRMEHLLRFALLALLDSPGSTLKDIVPMFTNKTFRKKVLEHVADEEVLKFWSREFPNMNYKNAFDGVAPIANKLGAFLANPLVRKTLCSPEKPIRFRKLMDEGTPLIVNLSKGRLGSDITNVLGGLIVSSMAHAAYTRVDTPEPQRRPYFLYADEFHSFTTDAFAGMLSELRKYRLGLILAHQHTSQVSKSVLESILGNVGTQIVFRVGANDAPLLAKQLSLRDTADLINQPNYHMLMRLMIEGEVSSYFTAKTLFASCSSGSILTKCQENSQSLITMNEFETLYQQAGFSSVSEAAEFLGYSEKSIYRYKSGEETARVATIRALQGLVLVRDNSSAQTSFTFVDLFAGIGGLRKAFESHGGRCVFTSEWDRFAQQTYHANFLDNRPIEGDITKIAAEDIPEHNVLVAGFPCQPFSIAGVSKKNALGRSHGFDDETQGTLFFDVLRILKHHRPEAFLLENVKNLRSHDKGRTFEVIRRKLEDELGYELHIQVIDAQHFVPQHRERIALVGFRDGTEFSWADLNLREKSVRKIGSILHPEDGTENVEGHFTEGKRAKVSSKYTLSDKLWKYLVGYAAKHKAKGNGFGYGLVDKTSIARTLSARYYKDGSEILVSRGKGKNPRRLTPRECARLMGYDDDFRIPVSDTQAYKQFGNSVAVPVFREVARIMTPHIINLIENGQRQELRKVG